MMKEVLMSIKLMQLITLCSGSSALQN